MKSGFLPRPGEPAAVIAMIHVPALPGTPAQRLGWEEAVASVRREAAFLARWPFDAILVENMHDRPYLKPPFGPEVTACMTRLALEARKTSGLPTGVQVLAAGNLEALAVAHAAGLDFIRVEGFVFGHVADEGWVESSAGSLLRLRRQLGAESVAVLADIKKKHSAHAATADVNLRETAEAAAFFGADGVIVTGSATGRAPAGEEVEGLARDGSLPVLVGSGVDAANAARFARSAAGLIVGSAIKRGGAWHGPPDSERIEGLMAALGRA